MPRKTKQAAPRPPRCEMHGKESYRSQSAAQKALNKIWENAGRFALAGDKVPRRAYGPDKCGWWHLTSEEKRPAPVPPFEPSQNQVLVMKTILEAEKGTPILVTEIITRSGVRSDRTAKALRTLREEGWIVCQNGDYTRYRATQPPEWYEGKI